MARGRTKVVIGELVFRVRASSTDFDKAVNQMVRKVERFGKRLDRMGQGMIKAFAPLTAGFALVTRTGMQFADTLSTLSQRMDDSAKRIHALRVLADRTGASYGRMEKGLNNVLQRTNQAAGGNEGYRKAVADLGLSMNDLMKLPVTGRMEAIARAYTGATDKARAYNAMTKLVGTFSTPELIAALTTLGTDGLDPLIDKYQRLGLLVEDSTVEVLARAQSSLNFLTSRWQTFASTIGAAVAPAIEKLVAVASILMDRIQEMDAETIQWIAGLTAAGTTIGITAVVIGKLLGPMARVTGAIAVMIVKLTALSVAWLAGMGPIGWAVIALAAVGTGILLFTDQLDYLIEKIAGTEIKDAIAELRKDFIEAAKAIGEALFDAVYNSITGAAEAARRKLLSSKVGITLAAITGIGLPSAGNTGATAEGVNEPAIDKTINAIAKASKLDESARNTFRLISGELKKSIGGAMSGLTETLSGWAQGIAGDFGLDSDSINGRLADIFDSVNSASDSITGAVGNVTSAIKDDRDKNLKEFAKKTLDDIQSGRLSTDRQTRLEAQAIVDGRENIHFRSRRFSRFRDEQEAAQARRDAEYQEYDRFQKSVPWISRPGWDDPNSPITRPGWDNPAVNTNVPILDAGNLDTNINNGIKSGAGEFTSSMLSQILAAIQTSNGYLEELTT